MHIISNSLCEMSEPVFCDNKRNISKCLLLKFSLRVEHILKGSRFFSFKEGPFSEGPLNPGKQTRGHKSCFHCETWSNKYQVYQVTLMFYWDITVLRRMSFRSYQHFIYTFPKVRFVIKMKHSFICLFISGFSKLLIDHPWITFVLDIHRRYLYAVSVVLETLLLRKPSPRKHTIWHTFQINKDDYLR